MKKFIITTLSAFFAVATAWSQYSYRLEIRQVFPQKTTIVSKSFNFPRELDQAVANYSSRTRGQGNYTISTTTPKGTQTRSVQNITWVQTLNGSTTYHSKATSPAKSYTTPTIWKGYACNLNGSPKGKTSTREFIYRVSVKDSTDHFKTQYVEKSTAMAEAQRIYQEVFTPVTPVTVVVYSYQGKKVTEESRITNANEYQSHLQELNSAAAEQKKQQELIDGFKNTMNLIGKSNDSIKDPGIAACHDLLKTTGIAIGDSVFYAEGLDALYREVIGKLLPKDRPDLAALFPDTAVSPSALLDSTAQLAIRIHQAPPAPPAYLEQIEGAKLIKRYSYADINYEYYERPKSKQHKKDHLLVNMNTLEYETGEFEPIELPDGGQWMKPKKTQKYDRNGSKVVK